VQRLGPKFFIVIISVITLLCRMILATVRFQVSSLIFNLMQYSTFLHANTFAPVTFPYRACCMLWSSNYSR